MRRAALAALCALLATAVLAGGQGPPAFPVPGLQSSPVQRPPQDTPVQVFRSGIELVEVDVYVTDENDQPVSGLTADDFEIFENDVPQVITTFAPVTLPVERSMALPFAAEPDVQTNNRPDRRVYLFLLGGTSDAMALRTRHLVRRFIDEHFGDNDIGAVITGRTYPGDRQDFTSNRRLLLSAVDRFEGGVVGTDELASLMELTGDRTRQCRSSACEATVILESAPMPWAGTAKGEATLLRDVLPAPPTTAREFGADETLVLFAEAYDNNGRSRRDPPYAIELETRLHDMDGRVVRTVSEQRSSRAERRSSGGHGFTLNLPLDAVPAGQYVLQVEVRSTRDVNHRAVRSIPVRVR